jgi:hypothetical protein
MQSTETSRRENAGNLATLGRIWWPKGGLKALISCNFRAKFPTRCYRELDSRTDQLAGNSIAQAGSWRAYGKPYPQARYTFLLDVNGVKRGVFRGPNVGKKQSKRRLRNAKG